jgi:hypothetical protein
MHQAYGASGRLCSKTTDRGACGSGQAIAEEEIYGKKEEREAKGGQVARWQSQGEAQGEVEAQDSGQGRGAGEPRR